MRDLAAEIRTFLSSSGPSTATEIGLGVRARRQAVQAVLAQDGFERVERPDGANPRGEFFNLSRPGLRSESSTNARASQSARVLALLSDGKPHSHHEIYAIGCVAHSRIDELRKRGHRISPARRVGDLYVYQLDTGEAA